MIAGAGTGIGRAMAIGFGSNGANVVVNYNRSKKEAKDAAAEIKNEGGRALAVRRVWRNFSRQRMKQKDKKDSQNV